MNKYYQIYEIIKEDIECGVLSSGMKLSSENMLCRKYDVSRQTVRAALELLENVGYINRVKGSGTYVNENMFSENKNQRVVGLLISYIDEYIFPQIISGIEGVLSNNNIGIEIGFTKNKVVNERRFLERMINSNVSGLIVEGAKTSFENPNLPLYYKLVNKKIPIIFMHNYYKGLNVPKVTMNDCECIRQLVQKLIDNGHKNIAGIFKYDDVQGLERYKGYVRTLTENKLKVNDDKVKWFSYEEIEDQCFIKSLQLFLKSIADCTAIVCYNDKIANLVVRELKLKGMKIPDDISIVSVDDTNLSNIGHLKIVSAIHPKEKMGEKAASMIVSMINRRSNYLIQDLFVFDPIISEGNSIKNITETIEHKLGNTTKDNNI